MLDDYEVVGLVPPKASIYDGLNYDTQVNTTEQQRKLYKQKIYTPNRRRALVVLALSDEAMRNCQAIIDKIKEHPNVGYISFTRENEAYTGYPCQGTYGKVRIPFPFAVIVSKPAYNKGHLKVSDLITKPFVTPYPDLSLTNGDYYSRTEGLTGFRYGYKTPEPGEENGEPVFGFTPPGAARGFKNRIFITYSF